MSPEPGYSKSGAGFAVLSEAKNPDLSLKNLKDRP